MLKIFILSFFICHEAACLVTVDSLILGKKTDDEQLMISDPLTYVFQKTNGNSQEKEISLSQQQIMLYFGIIQEAQNLKNSCDREAPIYYESFDKSEQVKKSLVATLQYIGLDITSRAISQYARYFSYTEEEFQNLVRRLVGNYCSENTTVISLRQLAKNLLSKFNQKNPAFLLPDFRLNQLFPPGMDKIGEASEYKKTEFLYTIKLFRSFCSWGGNVDDLRLLTPLLSSPQLASFMIQQFIGKRMAWNPASKIFTLKDEPSKTIQVLCENAICRRTSGPDFYKKIPKSLGVVNLEDDMKRMYCQEFQKAQYKFQDQEKRVKKWILQQDLDDEVLMVSQFMSLLTGVPDLVVRSGTFDNLQESLRSSVDFQFSNWASKSNANYSKDIFYEESVNVEKQNREKFFRPKDGNFRVAFDVNLGEVDRIHQGVGKIQVQFQMEFPQKFLRWMRNEWMNRDFDMQKKNEKLIEVFRIHILNQVQVAKKKFIIPPWKTDLEKIIVEELLEQLILYKGRKFDSVEEETIKIPVVFAYGPFALRYFHYRFRSKNGDAEIDL